MSSAQTASQGNLKKKNTMYRQPTQYQGSVSPVITAEIDLTSDSKQY